MNRPIPSIRVKVDVTNPGQFFACCGLLELADRLWPGAEGWFEEGSFCVSCEGALQALLTATVDAQLEQVDSDDDMASPIQIHDPFEMRLDWWTDESFGGKQLKVWAGSMRCVRIARAMRDALRDIPSPQHIFSFHTVVRDPGQPEKKVEPFYFDCRRGKNAQAIDIGFATNSLKMTSAAFPAVEFLCFVGLQRFRPSTVVRRLFEYRTWAVHLPVCIAPLVVGGVLESMGEERCRFETAFRTDQKKHKAFLPATKIGEEV